MLRNVFYTALLSIVSLMLLVLLVLPTPSKTLLVNDGLFIKNATVFNGEEFEYNRDLIIRSGAIESIGEQLDAGQMRVVDATDKTIIPGLIDAHTHSFNDALRVTLNFGVTTHIDMFSAIDTLPAAIKSRNDVGQHSQADLFSAGTLATVEGGHGTQFGLPVDTIKSALEAEAWVAARRADGSDFIKLVYMPYNNYFKSLNRETAAAIISAAHAKGLTVVAHISSQRAARELLQDGIDGFVHIFADEAVDDDFLQKAKARNVFIIPTLSVIASAANKGLGDNLLLDSRLSKYLTENQKQQLKSNFGVQKIPGFDFGLALANTRAMHDAGIRILSGSDASNPGTTYGASLHQEMALLVQAGLSPTEALNSATSLPAKTFKLGLRGALIQGSRADFVILNSSPEEVISNSLDIDAIYKNGEQVRRNQPESPLASRAIASAVLSTFDQGMSTPTGLFWSKTDDSIMSGNSSVELTISGNALKVLANVKPDFMFPWAGASLFGDKNVDISGFKVIEFKVRGTVGRYQLMVFSDGQTGVPPSQKFSVSDEWQSIQLNINDFHGLNVENFLGLAIVAGPSIGEFEYYIDDVKLVK